MWFQIESKRKSKRDIGQSIVPLLVTMYFLDSSSHNGRSNTDEEIFVRGARTCTSIKESLELTSASSWWCTYQGTDTSCFVMFMSKNVILSHEISDKNSHCPFVGRLCMRNEISKPNFGQTYNREINWFEITPAFQSDHPLLLPVYRLHRKSSHDSVLLPIGIRLMDPQWKKVFQYQYKLSLTQMTNKRNDSIEYCSHFEAEF